MGMPCCGKKIWHVKAQSRRSTSNHFCNVFKEKQSLDSMQSGSGDVSWQAQIGSVKSWTQSSSSGHTFQPYLCSKLDLLLLISCQEFFYQRPSFYLSPLLSLIWTPSAHFFVHFFSPSLSFPWSCRADTEQKWLMLIKIRKQGDVRQLLR